MEHRAETGHQAEDRDQTSEVSRQIAAGRSESTRRRGDAEKRRDVDQRSEVRDWRKDHKGKILPDWNTSVGAAFSRDLAILTDLTICRLSNSTN